MKDLGHAVINQTDANDIINAAATQGMYDLTLGLSDKSIREHGLRWITPDDPPWLLQAKGGERHTLQQPVPPAPPEDGEQQNGQPLVGRFKNYYDPTDQGCH